MAYLFEQFLSARSAYGPAIDASGERLYLISDLTGSPQLWAVAANDAYAWPEPIAVGLDRISVVYPSPKPGRLAFGADIGGNERTQIYLLDGLGPAPRPLTNSLDTMHLFGGWHPDGRTIIYASNERDPRYFDIFTLDVESGTSQQVFSGDATYNAGGFSPDGQSALVWRENSPSHQDVFVLELASGTLRPLTDAGQPSKYDSLRWSLDGRSIYCTTDFGREFPMVAKLDVATGALEPVVAADWDIEDYELSPDGTRLVYAVNVDGYSEVRLRQLDSGAEIVVPTPAGQACDVSRWHHTFSWFPDGERFAFAVTTPTATADVYVAQLAGSESATVTPVTRTWKGGLDHTQLVSPELRHFPTFDGRQIPAFVFRPPSDGPDEATGPRATVFLVHGGPESQLRPIYHPVIQYLVQRGFVVVAPNVRGSSGYGKEYLHLDDIELRMDSVRDLACGAEWAASSGLADPQRIAVMGQSYGGFMVLAAVTEYPDLWAAGIDIYGIANFVTFMENTGPWRRHLRAAEYGSLELHRDVLERISPIHKVDRITAPMMAIHGANDPRVPISETEQIMASLEQRGRPVEYVRFEDEGHGIVKLRNKLVAFPRIADFLEEHLGTS